MVVRTSGSTGRRAHPNRNGQNRVRVGDDLDPSEMLDGARRRGVLSEYARSVAGSPVNLAQEIARALERAFKAGVAAERSSPGFDPSARTRPGPREVEAVDVGPRARDVLRTIKLFATVAETGEIGCFLVRPGIRHPVLANTDVLSTKAGMRHEWGPTTTATLVRMGFLVDAPGRPEGDLTGTRRCLEYLRDGVTSTSTPATPAWSWAARK